MNRRLAWVVIAGVLLVTLASLNPGGLDVPLASIAFVILLFGCCVLPMLLVLCRGSARKGGCCEREPRQAKNKSRANEKAEGREQPKAGCH